MNDLIKLFEKPLPSTRSGAFFNAFSYPTKISPESIAVYIATITKPGDVILDTFGGSGSTGIAALLCEHPTPKMKSMAKELGVAPEWGKRDAIGYEIGTYGAFASKTITNRLTESEFKSVVDAFVKKAEKKLSKYYEVEDPNKETGIIRHVIWTEVLVCPNCGDEISYFEGGVQRNPVRFNKTIICPRCKKESNVDDMDYVIEKYDDSVLKKECCRKKRIPAWVYGSTAGVKWDRPAQESDIEMICQIENSEYHSEPKPIQWGELHRNGYHFGIDYLHQFYTKRNFIVMDQLWKITEDYDEKKRDALRLLLLSYNSSHCTLMTRVVAKKVSKDFVLTGAQSGVLYISRLPVEKNILLGLKRKAKPISEAYKLLERCSGRYKIYNQSSQILNQRDRSIDMVFTDPPFGDFIPYAEVNQINELWLDEVTNRNKEIIISDSQNKSVIEYKSMLTEVFSEIGRVLKKGAFAAVVFHAAKAEVWEAFENVIKDAGLSVEMTNILDKEQASFKQVVSLDSVQGDPLLLLHKESAGERILSDNDQVFYKIIEGCIGDSDFDERRVYSLYVNECLKKSIRVSYDAKEAYAIIRRLRKETIDGAVD